MGMTSVSGVFDAAHSRGVAGRGLGDLRVYAGETGHELGRV
jgi:hypothetical protein